MNALSQELADRIRGTISDLDRVTNRVVRTWSHSQNASRDQDVYFDSVALNIHGFYSGLERIFEIIARQIDGTVPAGQVWHRDLLVQMSQDIPDVRPGVISEEIAMALDHPIDLRDVPQERCPLHAPLLQKGEPTEGRSSHPV